MTSEEMQPYYDKDEKPYALSFTVDPSTTVLIVTDMQYASGCRTTGLGKRMTASGEADLVTWRFDRIERLVVPNIMRLLTLFRQKKLRVLYLTIGAVLRDYSDAPPYLRQFFSKANNYHGSREHEILDEIKPIEGEYVLNKTTRGAFSSTGIDSLLRFFGAEYLLFTGISTDQCIETTVRDAVDRGFRCVLIEDACAATEEEFHCSAVAHHQKKWGRVVSTDEIIKELSAATDKRN